MSRSRHVDDSRVRVPVVLSVTRGPPHMFATGSKVVRDANKVISNNLNTPSRLIHPKGYVDPASVLR
jgi:hypothetical protein